RTTGLSSWRHFPGRSGTAGRQQCQEQSDCNQSGQTYSCASTFESGVWPHNRVLDGVELSAGKDCGGRSLTKVPRRERSVNVKKCSQAGEVLESVSFPSHLS